MMIGYKGKKSRHNFFLADIRIDDIILGFLFFEATLPDINWRTGTVSGNVSLEMEDAESWTPPTC
jgi:hypothetical protein